MKARWMPRVLLSLWMLVALSAPQHACAQAPLTIFTTSLPATTAGANFRCRIAVNGGAQPYTWQVLDGKLPPGLKLNATQGTITGSPTTPGEYGFSVAVADSSVPVNRVERAYKIVVTAALGIEWKQPPAVHGDKIEGSMIVTNYTERDFTLTVIVMAVNEIGRATALGYQEFTLHSSGEQVIPFGASPGPGSYIVHADAVAEVAKTNSIYRARKQTVESLVIQAPE